MPLPNAWFLQTLRSRFFVLVVSFARFDAAPMRFL